MLLFLSSKHKEITLIADLSIKARNLKKILIQIMVLIVTMSIMMNYGYNIMIMTHLTIKTTFKTSIIQKKQCPYLGTILKRISLKK